MTRRQHYLSLFALALCLTLVAAQSTPQRLSPDSFDFHAILGQPPADDSLEHQGEMKIAEDLRDNRTDADVARINMEAKANAFIFAPAIGDWFKQADLPITAGMFEDAYKIQKPILKAAKNVYKRHRPENDPAHPMLEKEVDYSFPSGHATRSMMWATILSEMFPQDRDKLMDIAQRFGYDRVIGGEHFPSDILAGQKLGTEIARRLLADPDFEAKLKAAEQECHTDAATHETATHGADATH